MGITVRSEVDDNVAEFKEKAWRLTVQEHHRSVDKDRKMEIMARKRALAPVTFECNKLTWSECGKTAN